MCVIVDRNPTMVYFTGRAYFTILVVNLVNYCCCNTHYVIKVDLEKCGRKLHRFWDSTGFSPPAPGKEAVDYLTSKDVKMNLAMIGSLPFDAIKQVRIHWLLDLIQIRHDGYSTAGHDGLYDFSYLDGVLDYLVKYGLRPSFELMGNPDHFFNNLNNNRTQIFLWKKLIASIATRYINRYGADEVMTWKFETWNEPDLLMYNILNFTLPGYLRYIEACRRGLDEACAIYNNCSHINCHIKLGGPAGVFKKKSKHKLCWGLLDYCSKDFKNDMHLNHSSRHYYHRQRNLKQTICQLDFLSFHKKGSRSPKQVVELSQQFYDLVKTLYQHRPSPPLFNDEADILTGWWRNESWRADVRYAAAVSKVVIKLYELYMQNGFNNTSNTIFISNDNAFINYASASYYFTQRTLLARFIIGPHSSFSSLHANSTNTHSQVFQKPVYVVMGMLSYLYDYFFSVSYLPHNDRMTVIGTKRNSVDDDDNRGSACSILIVWSSYDNVTVIDETEISVSVEVRLPQSILLTGGKYAVYHLDNSLPHPFSVWTKAGAPSNPDPCLRARMRDSQGPLRTVLSDISHKNGIFNVNIRMTLPSVSLVHLCQYVEEGSSFIGKVTRVNYINVTFNEVLLFWSDREILNRCIKTYEVEYCPLEIRPINNEKAAKTCKFKRINKFDLILPSFQYAPHDPDYEEYEVILNQPSGDYSSAKELNNGLYRIRAVNYWDRPGSYSDLLYYG